MESMSYNDKIKEAYTADMPLRCLIADNPLLLMTLSRFDIPLGFGNDTVDVACRRHNIDPSTLLAVANYVSGRREDALQLITDANPGQFTDYLKRAHSYFLQYLLPSIRSKLIEAVDTADASGLGIAIIRYYDQFVGEVRRHMDDEDSRLFPYVRALINSERPTGYSTDEFTRNHRTIAPRIKELKDIIIGYYPRHAGHLLNSVLFDLITCEDDLRLHCLVEDELFIPIVRRLETAVPVGSPVSEKDDAPKAGTNKEPAGPTEIAAWEANVNQACAELLSEREREIIAHIAGGLSNKQIADRLCLSVHTVTTHRRNIAQKLGIHSVAGLAIFAIANSLISIPGTDNT